ncbi:RNA polymerase sigma-70 factor (family 1) [Myroides gitamensis]|uniref:sigma-70 family RNA polymerase sigma factor n=1 Tax=Myroides odoratus TaxID=256 RepID=UPI002166FAE2|nr:sigma-70 family RNA polymerase sigma factor [Myroides odoratus]MCS4239499.1 RNA polymerase sigma-70 factor (ECF subfamily) [Myroides odoratus]MDH6601346.1 RNA polymerase sigma-70 factor (family 1) [Myroides gitamensis]
MNTAKDKWINTYYNLHWDVLYQYSYNILRDQTLASDVVQDVFISIWDNYDSLAIDNAKAYLITAVKNKSLYYLKKVPFNTIQLESIYHVLTEHELLTNEEESLFKEQLLQLIYNKAQEVLPKRCLEIFNLRFYSHQSYKEIASKLAISESTVENQISKALKTLKSTLPYSLDFYFLLLYLFPTSDYYQIVM